MKHVKQLSVILVLSLLTFSFTQVNAQEKPCCEKKGHCEFTKAIPNLSDSQSQQIESLKIAHEKEVQKFRTQMDVKRAELKALQTEDNPDMKAINKKIEERSALRTELEKKIAENHQKIRKILNDKQKLAFDKLMSKKHHNPHKRGNIRRGCSDERGAKKCCSKKAPEQKHCKAKQIKE